MKIIHILPELEEGGVERLIPVYSSEQSRMGHEVTVISNGGRLVSLLAPEVRHIAMPVHRKNPFTGIPCARRIASLIEREEIDVIHAHSRVPAWVAYFARKFAPRVKFIYTAHARFSSLNYGIWAIKQADGVTCVSRAVRDHLKDWLPKSNPVKVIYNAPPGRVVPWTGSGGSLSKRMLFAGRISDKKDPYTIVHALARHRDKSWRLDVLGDGPAMPRLRELVESLGLGNRVALHGFSNQVPEAMSVCDLFLFPSLDEGLPLILIEALSAGTPVIASDISSVRELTAANDEDARELLPVGDVDAWSDAIGRYLDGEYNPSLSLKARLPDRAEMTSLITDFYREIIGT